MSDNKSNDDDDIICEDGCIVFDETDLELEEEAYAEDGYYRPKDPSKHYCQFCRMRLWSPTEAFSKWGFDDGNGRRMTASVAGCIEEAGYEVEYDQPGMHNEFIFTIKRGDEVIYDCDAAAAKHNGDDEKMFADLPADIRAACYKALWEDLTSCAAAAFNIPAEDIAKAQADMDAAYESAAK